MTAYGTGRTANDQAHIPAGISRRSVLLGAAGTGALALGAGTLTPTAEAATFVKDAHISWMPQMEANGYCWNNKSGQRQDLFTILKGYGITAISLRTWVNPSDDPANGHCGIEETARMAAHCRDSGLQVLLGFRSMNVLKSAGVTPGWVKIGNEQNSGICEPVGSIGNPAQTTGPLNAAFDVSKQVFPTTPVMVHLAQPRKVDGIRNSFNAYRDNGGRWDITGQKAFGGLGTFFREPEGYSPFTGYAGTAWDPGTRRPTAAMDGFLNV